METFAGDVVHDGGSPMTRHHAGNADQRQDGGDLLEFHSDRPLPRREYQFFRAANATPPTLPGPPPKTAEHIPQVRPCRSAAGGKIKEVAATVRDNFKADYAKEVRDRSDRSRRKAAEPRQRVEGRPGGSLRPVLRGSRSRSGRRRLVRRRGSIRPARSRLLRRSAAAQGGRSRHARERVSAGESAMSATGPPCSARATRSSRTSFRSPKSSWHSPPRLPPRRRACPTSQPDRKSRRR